MPCALDCACIVCVCVCMCVCVCVVCIHVCAMPPPRDRAACPVPVRGAGGGKMCGGCFIRGSLRGVRGMSGPPRVIGCLSSLCVGPVRACVLSVVEFGKNQSPAR